MFFTNVDNMYILKESKNANYIIYFDYLTSRKIVVPIETLFFNIQKNFLHIWFFGIGLKIRKDLHKRII